MATPNIYNYLFDEGHTFYGVYYAPIYRRIPNRNGMAPKVIVVHIQEGSNWGSWLWWRNVSASSTVLIAKNGDIWQVVRESDGPWTNGDVNRPSARGQAIINKFGRDPNVYTLSIETEGMTGEWPKDQRQLDSVVWQIKTWMNKYNIPVEYVVGHFDFNSVTRPNCPGNSYYNYIINRLKTEGTNVSAPVVTAPIDYDPFTFDGTKDVTLNDVKFFADKRTVTLTADTNIRKYASTESEVMRLAASGSKIGVLGYTTGEMIDGNDKWWVIGEVGRIWTGLTVETPKATTIPAPVPQSTAILTGKNIYNATVFYSAGVAGEGRMVTLAENSALYKYTDGATKVRDVQKGEKYRALLWTYGKEMNKESGWWLVGTGSEKNPYTECLRLPIASTIEKPF